jgi:hypothetical protein
MDNELVFDGSEHQEALGIIDTDVHHAAKDKAEFLEFLPKVWHEQYKTYARLRNGSKWIQGSKARLV